MTVYKIMKIIIFPASPTVQDRHGIMHFLDLRFWLERPSYRRRRTVNNSYFQLKFINQFSTPSYKKT